ncbi:ABC transporter permease [Pleomorphovibrio marinus]|uniref:ABC transporter permease n=1 Tax=Pleomorphovibrio marinus TaxID=2164132 RepID=UPI000E0C2DE4|nr:ABC transporter permease [Pleomorphovibrio marinus]
MIKNYFKIAFRNLLSNKAFSAITILGLAIGIATCLLILQFVQSELGYDSFHEKADRIVRVVFRGSVQGGSMNEAHVMPPVAEALKADYPEVEQATRIRKIGYPKVTHNNNSFRNYAAAYVDANLFQVFTFPLIKGDPATALVEPHTIVISATAAQIFFKEQDPLGKELWMNDGNDRFTVTGVMADIPVNSHFHFDLFASMSTFPEAKNPSWMVSEFYTYLLLQPGYEYKNLEAKLPEVAEKYIGPQLQEAMGISFDQFKQAGNNIGIFLQPLTSIHLHSDMMGELGPGGDVRYLYIFGAIALFMLLIASINFVNLSTASASKRAREVGVRKVLGSEQRQLVWQFLMEYILLSLFALLVAIVLVNLALPVFNELSGKEIAIPYFSSPWTLPTLLAFGLMVGIVAGIYPAFFLSSFKPVAVLKGSQFPNLSGKRSIGLRSGLVVFQFTVSVILIIGTIVVYNQLEYIQNKNLGYDKEQVLILPNIGNNAEVFRNQLLQDSRVENVSISGYLPSGQSYNNNFFLFPNENVSKQIKTLRYDVDNAYIPSMGMEIIAGRNFSDKFGNEQESIILNETAVKVLGWENEALGKTLTHSDNEGNKTTYQVIGIVKDFHFRSLHERIFPLVMVKGNAEGAVIAKINTSDVGGLLEDVKLKWASLAGDEPFEYSFLNDRFYQTYQAERRMGYILSVFASLIIFVACLGLFGLALFTAKQRHKEIGVRKVLGADVSTIVAMLSRDFLKLVVFSALLASPIAWWLMSHWLESFAYRIDISIWTYLGAGAIVVVVAWLAVGYEAIKAAMMNPVEALRSE